MRFFMRLSLFLNKIPLVQSHNQRFSRIMRKMGNRRILMGRKLNGVQNETYDIRMSDIRVSPSEVAPGDNVRVSVKLVNMGDLPGDYHIELIKSSIKFGLEYPKIDGFSLRFQWM